MKAKKLINELLQNHYKEAREAKENGEKVGWCTSNFPQEIIQTLNLKAVYPENHAAILASRKEGTIFCSKAESLGFSNDICSYAKINLGYMQKEIESSMEIPLPDYLLCCSNICHQLMKWYSYIAKKLDIPLILIDIPYNTNYDTDEIYVKYIKSQFWFAIKQLEKITGNKFDNKKFEEVMSISNEVGKAWNKISDMASVVPSPYDGTDLFVYMGAAVCVRGKKETLEAFNMLINEMENKVEKNKINYRGSEKFRILYEGICCWPVMVKLAASFALNNMNMVGAVYTNAYGIEYKTFDDMIRAYTYVPNAVNFERAFDMRSDEIKKKKCDGVLIHMSRSCKIWSGIMYEMKRQLENKYKIPVVTFDGDQADIQCFSEAQYDTRIQGFSELMNGI